MSNASTSAAQLGLKDILAEGVVELVRELVDDNGAAREDVQVERLERKDRRVALLLDIGIGWASASDTVRDRVGERGSRLCRDSDSAAVAMRVDCGAAAADPATAAELAETLRKSPVAEFRSRQDGFKIRDLPHCYHHHEACAECGGHGEHACDNRFCLHGEVTCPRCRGDGRETCHSCSGTGTAIVQHQVRNHDGSYSCQNGYCTCGRCHGQGRVGNCVQCSSRETVPCLRCGGTQRVACSPCGATGWFTHRRWTWLTGSVSRSWVFGKDAPDGFKEAVKAIGITDLPGTHAEAAATAVTSGAGKCQMRLECVVPHVRAEMRCRGVGIRMDAVGRSGKIPLMPTFLDDLLGDVWLEASRPAAPAAVIKAARSTRLSRGVLEHVCGGGKFDPQLVVAQFSGAVSEAMVRTLHQMVDRSYDRLGRSGVRRAWLIGAPAILAAAVASALYGNAGWLPPDAAWAAGWGVAIAPVIAVWLAAGASGRRGVLGAVGGRAGRRPRQGAWPWAAAILALGLHAVVLGSLPGARALGLPLVEAPPPGHAPGIAARGGSAPPSASSAPPREGLMPSGLPRLTARPEPPESETRGTPAVWRLETNLAQLGIYRGPPDGVPGSPAMRRAIDDLLRLVPDYRTAHIQEPLELTVRKVLRDDIRLALPADGTLASPLSNLARLNLSRDDLVRLEAAAGRAWREPSKEQSWRSADGRRAGRVVMAAAEVGPVGSPCGRFYLEVEVDGATDHAGPERACLAGGGWAPARWHYGANWPPK